MILSFWRAYLRVGSLFSFGQLIRENNKALDKTFIYSYNEIGGISSVKEYAYTTGDIPSTATSTKSYGYDLTEKDRLTLFGLKSITYDSLGCVKTYDGWTYGWNKGRLAYIQKGSLSTSRKSYDFTYNAYGQRTKVTYSFFPGAAQQIDYLASSTTEYTYDNSGRLIRESYSGRYNDNTTVTREYIFLYDESGIVGCLFAKNGATPAAYFYRKNLQGDVTAIYNESGNKVGEYAYDAWGNCTVLSGAATDVVRYNPIRYRGYYYDIETGLYYLNARYYNPQWRRFISPDDSSYLDPETPNGLNLYAYCNNDPVNYADPSGHFLVSTAVAVGFWIGLTVGAVAGATAGGIIAHNIAQNNGAEGLELFGWTMIGVLGGGLLGGITGAALGSSIGYGVGLLWGSAPVAGSNGAIALWSGGKGVAGKAAADFAKKNGAKLVTDTIAGKTLTFASNFLPKKISYYLWGKLSAEFVSGASYATIFLFDGGISYNSTFYEYELWVLLEKGIERVIEFVK